MHEQLINEIVTELRAELLGRFVGRIFQLSAMSLALDFGLKDHRNLFLSVEPANPRLYLIERRVKELDKLSAPLSRFGQTLRARIGGAKLLAVEKDSADRIVRFSFLFNDETGRSEMRKLVAQLTGRAANLLLLDSNDHIIDVLRPAKGVGQNPGEQYKPPPKPKTARASASPNLTAHESPSAAADAFYKQVDEDQRFVSRANSLRTRWRRSVAQRAKLKKNLQQDLESHGEAEAHRRVGDLLLANAATATRKGRVVEIVDYYSEGTPTITLEVEETVSLQEEAARRFRSYTKAKRAREEIVERLKKLDAEISDLEEQQHQLENAILTRDEAFLARFDGDPTKAATDKVRRKDSERIAGARKYLSSDGYEILVGRAAKDNDSLTFRVARPNDLWLHAADYPGSHVIVRNPSRKEIPHRTIIEAAQLAGKFSQAGADSKVVVHYTQRKFIAKPKGAAPGLVRMSSFRSITVEPKEELQRIP